MYRLTDWLQISSRRDAPRENASQESREDGGNLFGIDISKLPAVNACLKHLRNVLLLDPIDLGDFLSIRVIVGRLSSNLNEHRYRSL